MSGTFLRMRRPTVEALRRALSDMDLILQVEYAVARKEAGS